MTEDESENEGRTLDTCKRCDGYGSIIAGRAEEQRVGECWACHGSGKRSA
jgi:DnaJ-class molecular chaperone